MLILLMRRVVLTRMVEFFRSVVGRILFVVATGAIVLTAGYVVFIATTNMQNTSRLREMAEQTLLRAERTADYALITISNLMVGFSGDCNAAVRGKLSKALYTRGVVKDLRVMNADGEVLCGGLTQIPDVPVAQYVPGTGIAGASSNIEFHKMGEEGGLLGISWEVSLDRVFLAVVSVDSLMFDVYPASLRQGATATLVLDGDMIASYVPSNLTTEGADWNVFTATSDRFPLGVRLSVDPDVLGAWNREAEPYVMAAAGLFGIALGYLLVLVLSQRNNIEGALREGLRRGEFEGHIQPVFDLKTRQIVGGEVLARWRRSDGSLVQPVRFINFAEECGLIVPIMWQVIDSALTQLSEFLNQHEEFRIGFNITPDHLLSDGFADELCMRIEKHGVSNRSIVIELTERQDIVDIEAAKQRIQDLRGRGFHISLDDTGTGHNGLANVQRLGIDVVKIDKHFVDFVGVDKVAEKIVQMLVGLAQDLGIRTVAEGIETEEQLMVLAACGVDRGQGYLVSEAVPPGDFEALVIGASAPPKRMRAA